MPVKKRILFVDDEPGILSGLRRMLHRMRDEWEMEFVDSGEAALALMSRQPVDVIVSDMRMPGMNGAQLLEQVQEKYPGVVRLILSGYSDQELILRSVGPAHQFLSKPCDAETLVGTVKRSSALRKFLRGQNLSAAVGRIKSLPVLPEVYTELLRVLADEQATLADVGNIIARDVGMSAKMLQLVNSSFFGLRQRIDNPSRAVMYLGLDTVKSLVLSASVFSTFKPDDVPDFSLEALQRHSLSVGVIAKALAADAGLAPALQDDVFSAGILHDVGKLILVSNFPDQYRTVLRRQPVGVTAACDIEEEILGTNHAQLGGYLLGLWGLPDPIVEAVALHHEPGLSPNQAIGPLTFVHVANAFELARSAALGDEPPKLPPLDKDYLSRLSLADRVAHWQEVSDSILFEVGEAEVAG